MSEPGEDGTATPWWARVVVYFEYSVLGASLAAAVGVMAYGLGVSILGSTHPWWVLTATGVGSVSGVIALLLLHSKAWEAYRGDSQ